MKKTVSLVALLLAVLPALVFAYPGIGGGRGLLRVQNALVEDQAGLTISLHALGRNAAFPGETNKKGWVADVIAPELSYAPVVTKYAALELFGSWGGVFQNTKSATQTGFTMSTHDLKAGGKVSVPILPVLKLGFAGSYTFTSGRESRAGTTWLDQLALPKADGLAWAGLATLQLQDVLPSAPNFMFNYGKINDETRYGLGLELAGRGFALFGEMLSRQGPGSTGMFDTENGSIYITPGVVFGNISAVSLKIAYSFAFGTNFPVGVSEVPGGGSGEKASNELILGLVIGTPFGAREKPAYGTITGRVTDEKTGAALTADVGFPENDKMPGFTSDATGVFEVKKVRTGVTVVTVGAKGYQPQTVPLEVKKDAVTAYDFKLRSLVSYGTIAGTVVDAVTGAPMAARIEFPGSKIGPVNADATLGAFKLDRVEVGVYTLSASADKYIPATITLAVEDGKLATAIFKLAPEAGAVTVTGKVYDKKTNDPLSATVAFNDAVVTTDPATGVYKAQVMPGSYTVVVESKDYVKQTAALIVEKDKPLVRDFAMLKVGMSITLRGIYFDFDKSTIKPESRPALEDAAKMLNENPTIKVEIQGHTDSKGSDSYNLALSDRRAAAVVAYLVTNLGVDPSRLTSRGYGESMPIATNDTDAGRALNRRVEFAIIGEK